MARIYVKIYEYDSESQSMEVAFASSETSSQNPDDYMKYNFDATSFSHCTSKQEVIDELIKTGGNVCCQVKDEETIQNDSTKQSWFTELSGTSHDAEEDTESDVVYPNEVVL